MFGRTISSHSNSVESTLSSNWCADLPVRFQWTVVKEGKLLEAHLSMNLETEMIQDLQTEECGVYYESSTRVSAKHHQQKLLNYVSVVYWLIRFAVVHSLVRLRLPEDHLITALVEKAEEQLFDMSPKDIALVTWSLGRLNFPRDQLLSKKVLSVIERNMKQVLREDYLFDAQDTEQLSSEFDEVISNVEPESDKEESVTESQEAVDEEERSKLESYITYQTLGMYYWGLSRIYASTTNVS